ncbi:unnamed protein product [Closterium sp. Naga37s-1]|nr:unnamed protein product [Closterium sp. Naga37s-1]
MDEEPTVGSAAQHVVKPPATAAAARNVRLKQATLSFWKTYATAVVENNVAGPSERPRPRLNIDMDQLIADVYEDAHDKFKSQWSARFPWLMLMKTSSGLPGFKCSVCEAHAGDAGKCGRRGKGATDVQTQSFRKHAGTQKHKLAMAKFTALKECGARQPLIGQLRVTVDEEKLRVESLLDSLLFVSKCDAPMGLWVKLVREALAAKHAAENIPAFNVVDKVIRTVAEHLGRSGPWHQRFMDLQDVFTSTSLELQGIHAVRWLSRGDAVLRFITMLPALIVMMKKWDADLYALVTSYGFHFLLFFIAGVLEQLNILNRAFQHKELDYAVVYGQIRRTTSHIESRYVDCGDDFGGGVSERLSPFLARHGPGGNREVTVEGVDSDGRLARFKFKLHEDDVEDFEGPATHDGCVDVCTAFAEKIVHELESRLGDLEGMAGAKLFTPDEYPLDRGERNARCLQWLSSLATLFKADKSEEILPGKAVLYCKCICALPFSSLYGCM